MGLHARGVRLGAGHALLGLEGVVIRPGETKRGPAGGEYTRLADEPSIITAVLWDGRVVRMYLADLRALFVDEPGMHCSDWREW